MLGSSMCWTRFAVRHERLEAMIHTNKIWVAGVPIMRYVYQPLWRCANEAPILLTSES